MESHDTRNLFYLISTLFISVAVILKVQITESGY
jgi:hypothetical protein